MHLIKAPFKKSPTTGSTLQLYYYDVAPGYLLSFFTFFVHLCTCIIVLSCKVGQHWWVFVPLWQPLLSCMLVLILRFEAKNMMMMMMMQELCTQVVSIPAVVSDCGLRQLQAATSYQECKCLLHSRALLTTDWQCGTVCRQQCETVACHYTYAFKWRLNTIRCCCSVFASLVPLFQILDWLTDWLTTKYLSITV